MDFLLETFAEIDQTIDLFFRLQEENPEASCETIAQFTALPGTELYDIGLQNGLKSPERLEDWADWLFHDTDYKGERLPWFNRKQRQAIGNLNYLSILSKTGAEIVKTIDSKPLAIFLGIMAKPASKYFAWRLKNKYYNFVPEIQTNQMVSTLYVFIQMILSRLLYPGCKAGCGIFDASEKSQSSLVSL